MFSVGARPFNSGARQLYGGWTAAQAGNNLWGLYKAHSMQARYGAPGPATDAAKAWMKNWRKAAKENPRGTRAALRSAAGNWLKQRKRKPLSAEQKAAILQDWNDIPYVISPENAYEVSLVSGATYPAWGRLMVNPELTYPMIKGDEDVLGMWGKNTKEVFEEDPDAYFNTYEDYVQSLRERLAAMRANRKGERPSADILRMINQAMPTKDRHGALMKFEV